MNAVQIWAICLSFLVFPLESMAGSQDGPYVIWVNLSKNTHLDEVIQGRLNSKNKCESPNMEVKSPPEWISKDLIIDALMRSNKNSTRQLQKLIQRRYNNIISDGFDGIVIYNDQPKPQFSTLIRGWKAIDRVKPKNYSDDSLWEGFCSALPPITRPI